MKVQDRPHCGFGWHRARCGHDPVHCQTTYTDEVKRYASNDNDCRFYQKKIRTYRTSTGDGKGKHGGRNCYKSNGAQEVVERQVGWREDHGTCANGKGCSKNGECQSNWCHHGRCRQRKDCQGSWVNQGWTRVSDLLKDGRRRLETFRVSQAADGGKECAARANETRVAETQTGLAKRCTLPHGGEKDCHYDEFKHTWCDRDEQCQAGNRCVADVAARGGICRTKAGASDGEWCDADAMCTSGRCDGGVCRAKAAQCTLPHGGDKDCHYDEFKHTWCKRDEECQPGNRCVADVAARGGICRTKAGAANGQWCDGDAMCTSGRCDGGVCRAKAASCTSPGWECHDAHPASHCSRDEQCEGRCVNDGLAGRGGICRHDRPVQAKDPRAKKGEWCDHTDMCESGTFCKDKKCAPRRERCARDDQMCPESTWCNDAEPCQSGLACVWDGVPLQGSMCRKTDAGSAEDGEWCNDDAVCKAGLYCSKYDHERGKCQKKRAVCKDANGCHDKPNTWCGDDDPCDDAGRCVWDGVPGQGSVCRVKKDAKPGEGEWCNKETPCKAGLTCGLYDHGRGTCYRKKAAGEVCAQDEECGSGACGDVRTGEGTMERRCCAGGDKHHNSCKAAAAPLEWCWHDENCGEGYHCGWVPSEKSRAAAKALRRSDKVPDNDVVQAALNASRDRRCTQKEPGLGDDCDIESGAARDDGTWQPEGARDEYIGRSGNCDAQYVCHPHTAKCVERGADCVAGWARDDSGPPDESGWREDPSKPSTCMRTNESRTWVVLTEPGPGGRKCKDSDGSWAVHPRIWPVLSRELGGGSA